MGGGVWGGVFHCILGAQLCQCIRLLLIHKGLEMFFKAPPTLPAVHVGEVECLSEYLSITAIMPLCMHLDLAGPRAVQCSAYTQC